MARFIKSEYALNKCLEAGFMVFKAVKKRLTWEGYPYTYWCVEEQEGYVVLASKAQLLELGLSSNATYTRHSSESYSKTFEEETKITKERSQS